jgi:hypothetical protein
VVEVAIANLENEEISYNWREPEVYLYGINLIEYCSFEIRRLLLQKIILSFL